MANNIRKNSAAIPPPSCLSIPNLPRFSQIRAKKTNSNYFQGHQHEGLQPTSASKYSGLFNTQPVREPPGGLFGLPRFPYQRPLRGRGRGGTSSSTPLFSKNMPWPQGPPAAAALPTSSREKKALRYKNMDPREKLITRTAKGSAKLERTVRKQALDTPLDEEGIGFELLRKMGYKPGTGLGKDAEYSAPTEPIKLHLRGSEKAGLGVNSSSNDGDVHLHKLYCDICKTTMGSSKDMFNHLSGKQHNRKLKAAQYISQEPKLTKKAKPRRVTEYRCGPCGVITKSVTEYHSHKMGGPHNKKIRTLRAMGVDFDDEVIIVPPDVPMPQQPEQGLVFPPIVETVEIGIDPTPSQVPFPGRPPQSENQFFEDFIVQCWDMPVGSLYEVIVWRCQACEIVLRSPAERDAHRADQMHRINVERRLSEPRSFLFEPSASGSGPAYGSGMTQHSHSASKNTKNTHSQVVAKWEKYDFTKDRW